MFRKLLSALSLACVLLGPSCAPSPAMAQSTISALPLGAAVGSTPNDNLYDEQGTTCPGAVGACAGLHITAAQLKVYMQTGLTGGLIPAAGMIGETAMINNAATSGSVTIALGGVVTWSGTPPFAVRCVTATTAVKCIPSIIFNTLVTGTTGIATNTQYYVDPASLSGSTFKVATSVPAALAGTDVVTSGTDSGTASNQGMLATSGVGQQTAALSLTPGVWACSGNFHAFGVSGTAPTLVEVAVSPTGAAAFGNGSAQQFSLPFTTGAVPLAMVTGILTPITLSAQSTVSIFIGENWTGGATNPTYQSTLTCWRIG